MFSVDDLLETIKGIYGAIIAVTSRYNNPSAILADGEVLIGIRDGNHIIVNEEYKSLLGNIGAFYDLFDRCVRIIHKVFLGYHEIILIQAVAGRTLVIPVPAPVKHNMADLAFQRCIQMSL